MILYHNGTTIFLYHIGTRKKAKQLQLVLYDLRKNKKKMTQEQMATCLGITPKTYRSKELGTSEFTLDEMFAIAKMFNMKVDDIFVPRQYQFGTERK